MALSKAKLYSHANAVSKEAFSAMVKNYLDKIVAAIKADPNGFKVTTGLSPAFVRAKTDARLGSKSIEAVITLCVFVAMNSYRIAERDMPGNEFGTAMQTLQLKAGGVKGKGIKDKTTVVAMMAAYPDIVAAVMLVPDMQNAIMAQTVGGYKFTGKKIPFFAYLNGVQGLLVMSEFDESTRKFVCLALLAHQQCYVASRTAAGNKTRPDDKIIKEQRKKTFDFLMNSKSSFDDVDRKVALSEMKITVQDIADTLGAIGKSVDANFENWPMEHHALMDSLGAHVGWVKV